MTLRSQFVIKLRALSRRHRRSIIAIAGVAIIMEVSLGAGTAFAYFSSHGAGTGSASTGTPSNVTIGTGATTGAEMLYPGGTGDLVVTASNPNNFDVYIESVTIGSTTGCLAGGNPDLSIVSSALPFKIPRDTHNQSFTINGLLSMGADASGGCQGQVLTVNITATVQSS